ncbi:MAG TPA: hypothetical protein DEB09_05515 [Candidatus Magasanikbacteria bacterium]|nr:hypothetical protein [Candidatus Magasanikbacteria bacterium]
MIHLLEVSILAFLDSHWLILSFLAPMFWALVNMIDVYFVDGVYADELEGTIIMGIFQAIPCLFLMFFLKIEFSQLFNFNSANGQLFFEPMILWALLGGLLFNLSFYFYYKALFHHNDVGLVQILWGLSIVAVPFLAFVLFREKLPVYSYLGMAITLLGGVVLSFHKGIKKGTLKRYLFIMISAIVFFSLSMVLENKAYNVIDARGWGNQGFLLVFLCFNLGALLSSIILLLVSRKNPWPLIKKYYKVFILGEGITFLGNLSSQRALSVAPSVSYVATIEAFVPVFVLIFSLLIVVIAKIFNTKFSVIKKIYQDQLQGVSLKIVAIIIMAIGIYIISN